MWNDFEKGVEGKRQYFLIVEDFVLILIHLRYINVRSISIL